MAEPVEAVPKVIAKAPNFDTIGYRVDIPNWGIPREATVADIVRFEQEELGNDLGVSDELLAELKNFGYRDVVWVTKEKTDAESYLSEGQTAEEDISTIKEVKGGKIVSTDPDGGYLVLLPKALTRRGFKPEPIGRVAPERIELPVVDDLLPMPPGEGPPLPKSLGLKWPWKEK